MARRSFAVAVGSTSRATFIEAETWRLRHRRNHLPTANGLPRGISFDKRTSMYRAHYTLPGCKRTSKCFDTADLGDVGARLAAVKFLEEQDLVTARSTADRRCSVGIAAPTSKIDVPTRSDDTGTAVHVVTAVMGGETEFPVVAAGTSNDDTAGNEATERTIHIAAPSDDYDQSTENTPKLRCSSCVSNVRWVDNRRSWAVMSRNVREAKFFPAGTVGEQESLIQAVIWRRRSLRTKQKRLRRGITWDSQRQCWCVRGDAVFKDAKVFYAAGIGQEEAFTAATDYQRQQDVVVARHSVERLLSELQRTTNDPMARLKERLSRETPAKRTDPKRGVSYRLVCMVQQVRWCPITQMWQVFSDNRRRLTPEKVFPLGGGSRGEALVDAVAWQLTCYRTTDPNKTGYTGIVWCGDTHGWRARFFRLSGEQDTKYFMAGDGHQKAKKRAIEWLYQQDREKARQLVKLHASEQQKLVMSQ